MRGEFAREQEVEGFCEKIAKKIEEDLDNREAVRVLKEVGMEVLDEFQADPCQMSSDPSERPAWFQKYSELFRS
jgi:hypothetical protein